MSTRTIEAKEQLLSFQAAKEAINAIEWTCIPFDTVAEAIRRESIGRRLKSYICTLERLHDGSIVPEKLLIELTIELNIDPFHQSEAAAV